MSDAVKRFVYIHTWGIHTPERCGTPIYLATTAALMEFDVTLVFTTHATSMLKKGVAEQTLVKEGGASLRSFLDQALDAGVKFLVCAPSLDLCNMSRDDLMEGVSGIIGGAALNELMAEADVVFTF